MVLKRFIALLNMGYLINLFKRKPWLILLVLATTNLIIFWRLFGFHINNDTEGFIYLIDFFKGKVDYFAYQNRYLNPFYAVVSSTFLFFLSATQSLILINIVFYFGLVFVTYDLLGRVFKNRMVGLVSALFVMTAYPMLRYALTQVQDVGGYFWFLFTIYCGWCWWEDKNWRWLFVGSVSVSFGVLTKESGCMGALFVGILFLINQVSWKNKLTHIFLFSVLPLIAIVVNNIRGADVAYNSGRWFIWNWQIYAKQHYTFIKWFGVNVTTYNILWIFVLIGLYFLYKNWHTIDKNIKIYFLAIVPSSLSYFAWPIFIGRTVFISAWLFIAIAAYGILEWYRIANRYRWVVLVSLVVCLLSPYLLQITLRYANIFGIMEQCRYYPGCVWRIFWENRESYSKLGI